MSPAKKLTALLALVTFLFTLPGTGYAGDPFLDPFLSGGSEPTTPTQPAGGSTSGSSTSTNNGGSNQYNQAAGVPSGPLSAPDTGGAQAVITPTVKITSHKNDETVRGKINLDGIALATTNSITKIEYTVDKKTVKSFQVPPYDFKFELDTQLFPPGKHEVEMLLHTTTNEIHLDRIKLNFENQNSAPALNFIWGDNYDYEEVYSWDALYVTATDENGIKKVTYRIDNGPLKTGYYYESGPYKYYELGLGYTTQYSEGPHKITVTAEDNTGVTTTISKNIIVNNKVDPGDNNLYSFILPPPDRDVLPSESFQFKIFIDKPLKSTQTVTFEFDNQIVPPNAITNMRTFGQGLYSPVIDFTQVPGALNNPQLLHTLVMTIKDSSNGFEIGTSTSFYLRQDKKAPTAFFMNPYSDGNINAGQNNLKIQGFDFIDDYNNRGKITRVEVYLGEKFLGTATQDGTTDFFNFPFDTTKYPSGTYKLSSVVYDESNNKGISQRTVTFYNDTSEVPPTAISTVMVSPFGSTAFNAQPGQNYTIKGQTNFYMPFSVSDTKVGSVELYIDGILVQTLSPANTADYKFAIATRDYANGNHQFKFVAYNPKKTKTSEFQAVFNFNNDFDPPQISFTYPPADNTTVKGIIAVRGNVTDPNLNSVEFFLDDVSLSKQGSGGDFSVTLDTAQKANGNHIFKVVAIDRDGNKAEKTITYISRNDFTAPVLQITSPAAGTVLSGTINLNGTMSDDIDVTRVELYIDGMLKDTKYPASGSTNFSFSIDTKNQTDANHAFMVKAYDASGKMTSAERRFDINNRVPDTTPPAVLVFKPADNFSTYNIYKLHVDGLAEDNDSGVQKVEITLDNVVKTITFNSPASTANFSADLDIINLTAGAKTLTVKAFDAAGNIKTFTKSVTILRDTTPPDLSVTSPANNSEVYTIKPLLITGQAPDSETGLEKVEITLDGVTKVATLGGNNDFSANFDITNLTAGSKTITFKAYDASGNVKTLTRNITVLRDTTPPELSVTSPANNSEIYNIDPLQIRGQAPDYETGLDKVEVTIDGITKTATLGNNYDFSATFDITGLAGGSKTITVKAYDASGNYKTVTRTFTLLRDTVPPTLSITEPADGASVAKNSKFQITGNASDAGTGTQKVEIIFNDTIKTITSGFPNFSAELDTTGMTNGSKTLTIKAYDRSGNIKTVTKTITIIDSLPSRTSLSPAIKSYTAVVSDSLRNAYGLNGDENSAVDESFTVLSNSLINFGINFTVPNGTKLNYMVIRNGVIIHTFGSFTVGTNPFQYSYQMTSDDSGVELYFCDSNWIPLKHVTFSPLNAVTFDVIKGDNTPMKWQESTQKFTTKLYSSLSDFTLDGAVVNDRSFIGDVKLDYIIQDKSGNVIDIDRQTLQRGPNNQYNNIGYSSKDFALAPDKEYVVTIAASIIEYDPIIGGSNSITIGSKTRRFGLKTPPKTLDFTGQNIYGYQGIDLSVAYLISDPADYSASYIINTNLPAGLSYTLNGRNLVVSGKPSNTSEGPFQITLQDFNSGRTVTKTFDLKIVPVPAITTGAIIAFRGQTLSKQIETSGGFGPFSFSLDTQSKNALSAKGLSMSSTGLITGTPSAAGSLPLSVTITDQRGFQRNRLITFDIREALSINEIPAVYGISGRTLSIALTGSGGTSMGYEWSMSAADIQKLQDLGINFNAANGLLSSNSLSGVTSPQTVTVALNLKDSLNNQASRNITVNVAPEITMAQQNITLIAGESNIVALSASGGYGNYTWARQDTSWNSFWNRYGLQLTADGKISGTPQQAINESVAVIITDQKGFKVTKTLTVKTIAKPVVTAGGVTVTDSFGNTATNQTQSVSGFQNKFTFTAQAAGSFEWYVSVNDVIVDAGTKNNSHSYEKTFQWNTPGTYKVKFWSVTEAGKAEVEKTITVLATPQTQLVEKELSFTPEGSQMKGQFSFDIRNMGEFTGDAVLEIRSSANSSLITTKTLTLGANAATAVFSDVLVAPGDYYYKLITTQKLGALIVKKTEISAKADTGALISLTSPKNNDTVSGTISLTSSVNYSGGIRGVTYYFDLANGQTLSFKPVNQIPPYIYSLDTANVPNGTQTLRAVVENNFGKMTATKITLNFRNDLNPPTVAFKTLKNNDVVAGTVNLEADATDDIAMDRVDFFVDGVSLGSDGSAPYSKTWQTFFSSSNHVTEGPHEVKLVAYDKKGRSSETKITVKVRNDQQPPTVNNVIWPISEGGTWNGARPETTTNQSLAVRAFDYFGSAFKFFLLVDGTQVNEKTFQANTFGYDALTFDISKLANGPHKVGFYLEDTSGNKTDVQERNFNIQFIDNDKTPPQITVTSPTEGSTVKGIVKIKTNITDDVAGVALARFYYWNSRLNEWLQLNSDITAAPYETDWNTVGIPEGTTKLKVVARDKANRESTLEWNVIVDNNAFDNTKPAIRSLQNNGDGISFYMNFSTLNLAVNYKIQISSSSSFGAGSMITTTTASPYYACCFQANTKYYVRVQAVDGSGGFSDWSDVANITLTADPFVGSKPAAISSVEDLKTGDSAKVSLAALSGATSYQVEVSENANFFPATPLETTNLQPTLTGLKNGVTLYVRYRGIKNNLYSQYSDTKTFTIINPFTEKKTTIDPVKDLDGGNIEVNYLTIDGTEKYEIEIFTNPAFSGTATFKTNSTTTKAAFSGIQRSVQYYIRVRGVKGTANSQWATLGFKLPATFDPFVNLKTAITSVQDQNDGSTAKINFNAITGANTYEVEIYTNSNMTGASRKLTVSGSPATVENLQAGTPYYVRVRGVKGTNVYSQWSDTANFTLAAPLPGSFQEKATTLKNAIRLIPNITDIKMTVQNNVAHFEITRRATHFGELEKIVFDYSNQGIDFSRAEGYFAKTQPTGTSPVPGQNFQLEWRRLQLLMEAIPSAILKNESKASNNQGIPPGLWNVLYGEVWVSYDGRHYAQSQNTVSYTLHNYTINTTLYFPPAEKARLDSPLMAAYLTYHDPANNFQGAATVQDLNREADAIALAMGNDYSVSYPFDPDSSTHPRQEQYSFLGTAYTLYTIKPKDASKIELGGMQEIKWSSSTTPGGGQLSEITYRGYYDDQAMKISFVPLDGFNPATLHVAIIDHLQKVKGVAYTNIDIIKFLALITAKKLEKLPNPDPVTSAGWPNLYRFTFRDTDGKNYRIDSLGANSFTAYRDYGEDTEDYKRALQKQFDDIFGTGDDQYIVSASGTWNNPVFTFSIEAKINPSSRNKVSYQYNLETKTIVRGTGSFSGYDGRAVSLSGADFDLLYDGLNLGIQSNPDLSSLKFPAAAMLKMTNLRELHVKNILGVIPGIYSIKIDGKYYSAIKAGSEVMFQADVATFPHIYEMLLLDRIQRWYNSLNGNTAPLRFFATAEPAPSNPLFALYHIHALDTSTNTIVKDLLEIGGFFQYPNLSDSYGNGPLYDPSYYDNPYWPNGSFKFSYIEAGMTQDPNTLSFKFKSGGQTYTLTGQSAKLVYKNLRLGSSFDQIASLMNINVTSFNATSSRPTLYYRLRNSPDKSDPELSYTITSAQANLKMDTSEAYRNMKAQIADALGPDYTITTIFGSDNSSDLYYNMTKYRAGKNYINVINRSQTAGALAYLELEVTVAANGQITLLPSPSGTPPQGGWQPYQMFFFSAELKGFEMQAGHLVGDIRNLPELAYKGIIYSFQNEADLFWRGLNLSPFSATTAMDKLKIIRNLRLVMTTNSTSINFYFDYTDPVTKIKKRYRFYRTPYPYTYKVDPV